MEVPEPPPERARSRALENALRVLWLFVLLFGFLVAIETISKGIKALADPGALGGTGDQTSVFALGANPFAALSLGVLFTVLVQSSSTTTSTIVAAVGSGVITVEQAVPMVFGANIGTTITNTLVSIGHVRRAGEFRRAYAAATVHDFFNLMAVVTMFPLELATRALSRSAHALMGVFGGGAGSEYKSPVKVAIKTVHKEIVGGLEYLGLDGVPLGVATLVAGIILTFACLAQITITARKVMAGRVEKAIHRALGGNLLVGLGVGIAITIAVQSSSVTTSLLVPMCAAGVMSLETALPIMLGANVGTTVTGVLASMAQDRPEALEIALVHVIFNLLGVVALVLFPSVRHIPIRLARALSIAVVRNRAWIAVYVLGVFVALPLLGWLLWKGEG